MTGPFFFLYLVQPDIFRDGYQEGLDAGFFPVFVFFYNIDKGYHSFLKDNFSVLITATIMNNKRTYGLGIPG